MRTGPRGGGDEPWGDITTLLHNGPEREPETVHDGEVVSERRAGGAVLDLPLVRAEAADEEEDETDADVGEYHV